MSTRSVELIGEVKAARLPRPPFVQTMAGLGLTQPTAAQLLATGRVHAPRAPSIPRRPWQSSMSVRAQPRAQRFALASDVTLPYCSSSSDATFQSSALVWVGTGPAANGGVNSETTSWM